MNTKDSSLSDAEICRLNGWFAGTVIEGDEGYGPERIEITAVGRDSILAISKSARYAHEGTWTLTCRNWKKVAEGDR